MSLQKQLHQWFTPAWAAEAIVDEAFGWIGAGHRVVEPSCGDGAFLCALPGSAEVVGVEIDPLQAALAARASGRRVIVGDFMTVPREELGRVHAVLGNPPFQAEIVSGFLRRSHAILEEGGQVGFVLPSFIFQASSSVERMNELFTVQQAMIPRNLFPRLSLPLVFATFTKERNRRLFGFMLYREAQEIRAIKKCWRERVAKGRDAGGVWLPVVREILAALGGSAELEQIYRAIQGLRPTSNPHWQAKVRQVLGRHGHIFERTAPGRYRFAAQASLFDAAEAASAA